MYKSAKGPVRLGGVKFASVELAKMFIADSLEGNRVITQKELSEKYNIKDSAPEFAKTGNAKRIARELALLIQG